MDKAASIEVVKSMLEGFEFRLRKSLYRGNCYYITFIERVDSNYKEFEFENIIGRNFEKHQKFSRTHYLVEFNNAQ